MQTTAEVSDSLRRGVGHPECRCGCGTTVKTAGRQFAQGHHARVASRNEAGQLVPIYVLGLCECGCGERVLTRGARFRPGHHARTAEWKQAVFPAEPQRRPCGNSACGKQLTLVQSATSRFCDQACYDEWRLPKGWCRLHDRIRARVINQSRILHQRPTLKAFAIEAKVPYGTLQQWFKVSRRCVSGDFLRRVVEVVGNISIKDAIKEAGGKIDDVRRAEKGRELIKLNRPKAGTPEFAAMRAKMNESHRLVEPRDEASQQRRDEASRKMVATRRAKSETGAWVSELDTTSRPARARSSLMGRLRHDRTPSREELRRWANDAAKALKIPQETIWNTWRRYLIKRDLWPTGGRPRKEQRCASVIRLLGETRPDADGGLPYGFAKQAAAKISAEEKVAVKSDAIRRFLSQHVCPNLATAMDPFRGAGRRRSESGENHLLRS